jgi:hypothetical protein
MKSTPLKQHQKENAMNAENGSGGAAYYAAYTIRLIYFLNPIVFTWSRLSKLVSL